MKKTLRFLISILLYYIVVFGLAKVGFMLYNHASDTFGAADVAQVWWAGLAMDASTAGYLLILPWLVALIAVWWPKLAVRRVLRPYFIIVGFLLTLILAADIVLYEYWQYKLDASVLNYLNLNNGAAESVSVWFLLACFLALVLFTALLAWPAIRFTPRTLHNSVKKPLGTIVMLVLAGLIFLMIRGGVQESTMNVGRAYYSEHLFLNHAAVNPVFSLGSSISKNKKFGEQFRYASPEECDAAFQNLYPADTEDVTDSLLRTDHPQLIMIQLESYGAQFIEELGGRKNVSPEISRLIKEGVLFENVYANSYRTDRGTVSAFGGYLSYPTVSLMKIPAKRNRLPSIAHALVNEGYATDYTYGGDINIMGKKDYLVSAGFQKLTSSKDFSATEINGSKWGANDSLVFHRVLKNIASRPAESHWFTGFQTIDSHEPFDVPYHRLQNKVENAFAWTDHCLGQFIDGLKKLPVWDNLLIVIYADHGIMYDQTYEDPEFFHIPMLWLGGALKEPRRISTLMNQSDMAATILSQMGVSHKQFSWSRNIFSKNYTYPFVYSSYPSGILFKDSTGVSIFDTNADKPILGRPAKGADLRLKRGKAILQKSYDLLEKM